MQANNSEKSYMAVSTAPSFTTNNSNSINNNNNMNDNNTISTTTTTTNDSKQKSKGRYRNTHHGTLRQLNLLLREVEVVEQNCNVFKSPKKEEHHLDNFQQAKIDLNNLLKAIKDSIHTYLGLQERTGDNREAIQIKYQIERELGMAREVYTKMVNAFKEDERRFEKKKAGALTPPELDERRQILDLFKQDLDFTENMLKPKKSRGEGFQIAQNARARRQKQREEGILAQEVIPLTAQQQTFIQDSIQRDQLLDQKLDVILQGVKQLGMIAYDINEELVKQDVMLDEVEQKMDKLHDKLETRNVQMKKILQASGGALRWLPVLILFIIFLALCGYIYNSLRRL